MELLEKSLVLQRNDEAYPIETSFVNRFGNKVKLPAHSTLFCEKHDADGFPIYEFIRNEFFVENGEVLEASEMLEKKIEARERLEEASKEKSKKEEKRVVAIALFYRNRETGEKYHVDEEELKSTIDVWSNDQALVVMGYHDRDPYTFEDEKNHIKDLTKRYHSQHTSDEGLENFILENQTIFEGNQKGPHIHIDIAGARGKDGKRKKLRVSTLCNKLHISRNCIKFITDNTSNGGSDGFLDQVRYLTHETEKAQADGKFVYSKEIVYANFDWEQALFDRELENAKYGKDSPTLLQKWKHDVLLEGKKLKECKLEDWDLYSANRRILTDLREEYLRDTAPTPPIRLSYYIEAKNAQGGEGKTQCAKCFARTIAHDEYGASMYEPFEKLNDYIYMIGDPKVALQHYDGQPIVIFNDFKAGDLLQAFKGRDALKNFLEPFPEKVQCDIKYGSTTLIPKYVIVNGIQTYDEFIEKLASTKNAEDDEESRQAHQFDRRFFGRVIIDSTLNAMKLLVNHDYLDDTPERQGYLEIKNIRINFRKLLEQFDKDNPKKVEIEEKSFRPMLDQSKEYSEKRLNKKNQMTSEFLDYGEEVIEWKEYETEEKALECLKNRGYKKGSILYTLDDDLTIDGFHRLYKCTSSGLKESICFEGSWDWPYWFLQEKKLILPIQKGYPPYEDYLPKEELEEMKLQANEIDEDVEQLYCEYQKENS